MLLRQKVGLADRVLMELGGGRDDIDDLGDVFLSHVAFTHC